MNKIIPVLQPDMPDANALLPYLQRIDANRHYTNFGPLVTELEGQLATACAERSGHPVAVTSVANCTAGLQLALMASVSRPRARVLVPSLTFPGTVSAILQAGFEPVLTDVDPASWVMTPAIARDALRRVRSVHAVMPVAAYGRSLEPAGWDEFQKKTGLPVVIDAAGAFGNQAVGQRTIVAYSMHATKALGAGEGGFVVAQDEAIVAKVRRLSNFGFMAAGGLISEIGINGKMSEYAAAVGLAALAQWPAMAARRHALWQRYAAALEAHCPEVVLQDRQADGIYSLLVVKLPARLRAETAAELLAAKGIQSRRWYCPGIYAHPAFLTLTQADDHNVVKHLDQHLLGLPFHNGLNDDDIERITTVLGSALGHGRTLRHSISRAQRSHRAGLPR